MLLNLNFRHSVPINLQQADTSLKLERKQAAGLTTGKQIKHFFNQGVALISAGAEEKEPFSIPFYLSLVYPGLS
uniref:Uncharacterized protein n=1 Tax=Ditylenchus dipsaci TaxID=166011 RepID=A0A915CU38_9BILA